MASSVQGWIRQASKLPGDPRFQREEGRDPKIVPAGMNALLSFCYPLPAAVDSEV